MLQSTLELHREHDKGERGVTLLELLIATALIAILAAIVVPNAAGLVGSGKKSAYTSDRETLKTVTDVWRASIGRTSGRPYPILQGGEECLGAISPLTGQPSQPGCNPYLDIAAIVQQGMLSNTAVIRSADTTRNTTATNEKGNYGWYADVGGDVKSYPAFDPSKYP